MAGAALVLLLAGLIFPILLLLAALVIDGIVVTWALYHLLHDEWWPRIVRQLRHGVAHGWDRLHHAHTR